MAILVIIEMNPYFAGVCWVTDLEASTVLRLERIDRCCRGTERRSLPLDEHVLAEELANVERSRPARDMMEYFGHGLEARLGQVTKAALGPTSLLARTAEIAPTVAPQGCGRFPPSRAISSPAAAGFQFPPPALRELRRRLSCERRRWPAQRRAGSSQWANPAPAPEAAAAD